MIKDKDLGLKIAENKEEEFWEKRRIACEAVMEALKDELKLNEAIMEKIVERLDNAKDDNS